MTFIASRLSLLWAAKVLHGGGQGRQSSAFGRRRERPALRRHALAAVRGYPRALLMRLRRRQRSLHALEDDVVERLVAGAAVLLHPRVLQDLLGRRTFARVLWAGLCGRVGGAMRALARAARGGRHRVYAPARCHRRPQPSRAGRRPGQRVRLRTDWSMRRTHSLASLEILGQGSVSKSSWPCAAHGGGRSSERAAGRHALEPRHAVPRYAALCYARLDDGVEDLLLGLAPERRHTRQQDVQDHAARPDVGLGAVLAAQDLRGEVEPPLGAQPDGAALWSRPAPAPAQATGLPCCAPHRGRHSRAPRGRHTAPRGRHSRRSPRPR